MSLNRTLIQKHITPFEITDQQIQESNHIDLLHIVEWLDDTLIVQRGNHVVLKSNRDCYICREGLYNIQTGLLTPTWVALQKIFDFNLLQTCIACQKFLKSGLIEQIRNQCLSKYGSVAMPTPRPDLLNYVVDDNIIFQEPVALKTVFGILADQFFIDRKIIEKFINLNLITVDPNYNVCFNSFDESGNVISTFKMSRYKHSNTHYSFNLYVTKRNVGFVYSPENEEWAPGTAVTIFDSPLELLSYLTLEQTTNSIVPSVVGDISLAVPKLSTSSHMFAMYYGNTYSVREWLRSHENIDTINIAIKLNRLNEKRIRTRFYYDAKVFGIPNVVDLREILKKYLEVFIKKFNKASFKIDGWNALLKFIKRPPVVRKNKETKESSPTTSYHLTSEQIESIIKSRSEKNNQEKNTNKGA